jgi:N-acyl homoserine lactone hydrolase
MKSICHIMDFGTNQADLSLITKDLGKGIIIRGPVYGVFVEHPLANIIVDTGINNSKTEISIHADHRRTETQTMEEQLKLLGLDFNDIDFVIMSHLHWDHTGNISKFKRAKVIVRQEEMNFARRMMKESSYFLTEDIDHPDINYIFLEDDRDFDFLEGIKILSTPGHTTGSQSVLVETDEGNILISGDMVYNRRYNFEEEIMPGICYSEELERKTIKKIKSLGKLILLPGHDPFLKLKKTYGIISENDKEIEILIPENKKQNIFPCYKMLY